MAELSFKYNDNDLVIDNVPAAKIAHVTELVVGKIARQVSAEKILADVRKYQTAIAEVKNVEAAQKVEAAKEKRGRKNSGKRLRIIATIEKLDNQLYTSRKILEFLQAEFNITYANAYYYLSRVYCKTLKSEKTEAK